MTDEEIKDETPVAEDVAEDVAVEEAAPAKAAEEAARGQHYAGGREYAAYRARLAEGVDLWTEWSERYINWRQLEILGLMSKGNWA